MAQSKHMFLLQFGVIHYLDKMLPTRGYGCEQINFCSLHPTAIQLCILGMLVVLPKHLKCIQNSTNGRSNIGEDQSEY